MDFKLSVILIRCDEMSDFTACIESVLAQKDDRVEYIAADAVDGQLRAFVPEEIAFFDISQKIYENMAQVKNEAVKMASCKHVLILTTDRILEDGILDRCLAGLSGEICYSGSGTYGDGGEACNSGEYADGQFKKYFLEGVQSASYVVVNRESFGVIGGWNEKLPCAEDYELLLRACDFNCIEGFCAVASELPPLIFKENYFTYAYMLGKYVRKLKSMNIFDGVFSKWYVEARQYGIADYYEDCVKKMIGRQPVFDSVDADTRPILIFTYKNECSGTLYSFALGLGSALRKNGLNVQIIALDGDSVCGLKSAILREYRAVIGFQTSFFTEQLENGGLAGNIFKCPKFNYIFDHPLYVSYFLMLPVNDFYVLQQDETYAAYIRKYYPQVRNVWHFPPAGIIGRRMREALAAGCPAGVESAAGEASGDMNLDFNAVFRSLKKTMDISFVATYNDYRERMAFIRTLPADIRRLSWQMINQLKNNPKQSAEEALSCVLEKNCRDVTPREFVVLLHKSCEAVRAVSFYYREKIVKVLLDAGLKIDVFGDAWRRSPYADNLNLRIHGDVSFEEGLDVMAESRISLNVMTWHKGGMTERVANSMLNGSVCVTDETTYINRNFTDGENIITFELDNIEALPKRLKALLSPENREGLNKIAVKAFEKAEKEHTWNVRARQFLDILDEIENNEVENENVPAAK